ncbi:ABC transporter permease [Lactobacillus porci]|uniref:ABC transporter permease n=1 Tax=Lactobacillus porci TaxID=2012477 RepID=A0A6A8MFN0_9LACO|nr:ABC transporter permease [Lactobacillus porci]MST87516.1 ABC transporter permease [Lactobacillus porci]
MIGFKKIFAAMFKEKSRTTWLSLGIEVIFILLVSLYFGIRYGFSGDSAGIGVGIAAMLIFCMCTWYQIDVMIAAYRVNRSQTWRQVPVTAGKFLTANLLTGLVTAVIFALVNLLIFVIVLLPFIFGGKMQIDSQAAVTFQPYVSSIINWLLYMTLFALVIFVGGICFWLLVTESASVLGDFLPLKGKTSKFAKAVILLALLILMSWGSSSILGAVIRMVSNSGFDFNFFIDNTGLHTSHTDLGLPVISWLYMLAEVVYVAILWVAEYFVFKKGVEAKK